jgi:hypothetical protein
MSCAESYQDSSRPILSDFEREKLEFWFVLERGLFSSDRVVRFVTGEMKRGFCLGR